MFCLLTGNRSLGSQCEGGGGGDSEIELEGYEVRTWIILVQA